MASESSMTIPQDLIIEILYRLPAKYLGRFRCVSKDWLSLLSEPKFIKSHISIVSRNHLLFIDSFSFCSLPLINYYPTPLSRPTKVDHLHTHPPYNFHGSCNGLVLVSYVSGDLVVFNPTTRDFVSLPKIRKDMFYGFGYDTATDDYKVVAMPCNHDPDYDHVNVYSLRTNAWRQVIKSSYGMYVRSGVLFNGFLHWIAIKDIHHLPVIYAFSLADEKFSKLSSPKDDDLIFYGNLVALGEKLAIFNGRKGEIWLMNEYGVRSSWTKIVFDHAFDRYPVIRPMIFYDNGKIMFVNSNRNRMMIYDFEERTFCKSVDISYTIFSWAKCIVYVESLVSPKSVRTVLNKMTFDSFLDC